MPLTGFCNESSQTSPKMERMSDHPRTISIQAENLFRAIKRLWQQTDENFFPLVADNEMSSTRIWNKLAE